MSRDNFRTELYFKWGGAKMLGKLPVPGRPTYLDYSRARAYCACSRCGWGFFVVIVLSEEPRQNQGQELVDRKLVKAPPPPVNFIAGRPRAAFLFWFFGDFRCGALLFMVIHIIYKYKNR